MTLPVCAPTENADGNEAEPDRLDMFVQSPSRIHRTDEAENGARHQHRERQREAPIALMAAESHALAG